MFILPGQNAHLKKLLFLSFTVCIFQFSFSQSPFCALRISLLTCAPGEELYSTFGHTAIRVQDSSAGTDAVYNYGTFEFAPDFYSKFIRGKLLYSLSVEDFRDFLYTYQLESRRVVEQVLQLSCEEKHKLFRALQINSMEANRHYRYDFLFDNCTTRAKEIIARNTDKSVVFKPILQEPFPSFRDLIHRYLEMGHQDWSKLGIDILLGVKLDKKPTNEQAMFLPDYLLKGLDNASTGGNPLVQPPQPVLEMPSLLQKAARVTPALLFWILLAAVSVLSLINKNRIPNLLQVFDFLLFFVLGLAGCLLLFMWFGTDHIVCRNNYNLLWALPSHVVFAFMIHRNKPVVKSYFRIVFGIALLLLLLWFFLPQELNPALIPLVLLSAVRSWFLSKRL